MEQHIDELLDEKIKPIIKEATAKVLGMTINELTEDITAKLAKSPLLDVPIDTTLKFKEAKRRFKKIYLEKMLQVHLGNISEVARYADIDRRSIHRLIKALHINCDKIKKDLLRPYDIKSSAVSQAIEHVLEQYKGLIHPKKLKTMYQNVDELSNNLLRELPEQHITLKQAENEFEKQYIKKALEQNNKNISKTAKKIGVRYETLHRKMKSLLIV